MKPRHRLSDPVEVQMYWVRFHIEQSRLDLSEGLPWSALAQLARAVNGLQKIEAKLDGAGANAD